MNEGKRGDSFEEMRIKYSKGRTVKRKKTQKGRKKTRGTIKRCLRGVEICCEFTKRKLTVSKD